MVYKNLSFNKPPHRPFFFTDFVTTIDGKIFVNKKGYWPIGSKKDYDTFTYLRAHADVIVQGANSAKIFGKQTVLTHTNPSFKKLRQSLGRKEIVDYIIISKHPQKLEKIFKDSTYSPTILTTNDMNDILTYLKKKKYTWVYIDGSRLLRSVLEVNLMDEIFVTITPKIFSGEGTEVTTIAQGVLFPPNTIKHFTLVSVHKKANEVFLRYRRTN